MSYSRSRAYYDNRVNHPLLTYRRVVGAADALGAGEWIEHFRQRKGARGKQSAMIALPKLIDAISELLRTHPNLPLELRRPGVLLRDPDRRPFLLPSTREVARMGGKVLALNEAIVSVDARDLDCNALTASVSRIFNTNIYRGGRFYAHGASWQNVKRDVRKRITLDGEPVVELDFATLHPAMLYAEVSAPMPRDCYARADWPRLLVKRAMLILLNASSLPAARLAIAYCSEMEALPGIEGSPIARAARLISDIKEMHQPVAPFFHTDAGARLM